VNGGTASRRATAPSSREPILGKEARRFGEIFRYLSYLDIGSAAIMSGGGGDVRGKILSLCRIEGRGLAAMEKLILPELRHMVSQLQENEGPS